ncbi:hypothetical protein BCR41DRAFT_412195 [Lobosporangium transversale]|uniref:Uncharacterized protein n=1 Tax=Lobosporangium transversale TaxID=64571 RepID=A0A1Y2GDJ3_9FUNG|nr:hypothetical protein BCR41DRAFT_412195 [Lobosporangium transversale]ORZ07791.1 hypothetical protein BCR41DRAFT_412195 [Lobosporangium transversale]|eukprot:XP_021878157.1 hypothetical protein BCR41DRAFT_412195 [Lobosporangium transversale]
MLTEFCFNMLGRHDGKGLISNAVLNAWLKQLSDYFRARFTIWCRINILMDLYRCIEGWLSLRVETHFPNVQSIFCFSNSPLYCVLFTQQLNSVFVPFTLHIL